MAAYLSSVPKSSKTSKLVASEREIFSFAGEKPQDQAEALDMFLY